MADIIWHDNNYSAVFRACSHYRKCPDFELIFCQTIRIFAGIVVLRQETSTKHGGKYAERWAFQVVGTCPGKRKERKKIRKER